MFVSIEEGVFSTLGIYHNSHSSTQNQTFNFHRHRLQPLPLDTLFSKSKDPKFDMTQDTIAKEFNSTPETAPTSLPINQDPDHVEKCTPSSAVKGTPTDSLPTSETEKSVEVEETSPLTLEARLEVVETELHNSESKFAHAVIHLSLLFNPKLGWFPDWEGVPKAAELVAKELAIFRQHQVSYAEVERLLEYQKELRRLREMPGGE